MPFLTLNELTIPCSVKRGDETYEILGDQARALDASLREHREAEKRLYSLRTPPQTQEVAEALKGLLLGRGVHFSWDVDLFSDGKGLPPVVGFTGTPGTAAAAQFGAGGLRLAAAQGGTYIVNELPASGRYTIMWWRDSGGGAGAHVHRVRVNDGTTETLYEDGVVVGGPFPEVTVAGTTITIAGGGGGEDIDDLVVLPFTAPAAFLTGAWANPVAAWSNPPALFVDGTQTNNEIVVMKPRLGKILWRPFQNQASAAWEIGGQVIEFTLAEV